MPRDYAVWVSCNDSIYPITGINDENVYDMVSISSAETYGELFPKLTVGETINLLEPFPEDGEICLEAASNIDPELDMQLDSARKIAGWSIDDTCRMVLLISGEDVDY